MTILFYDLNEAHDRGERRHPADVLKELGITYTEYEGQPIADQIKLHGCTNVPDTLPPWIEGRKTP